MAEKTAPVMVEEQTGRVFAIKPEEKSDRVAAIIGAVYLAVSMLFFLWQLFDVWVGRYSLATWFGYLSFKTSVGNAGALICIYTFIGGALGAIINEIRGFLFWHCDHEAYGRRYI